MITNQLTQLTYLSYISFFLVQEIFSADEPFDQPNSTINPNDRTCGRICLTSIIVGGIIMVAVIAYAIFRFRKQRLRQKTGHIEEIVAMKYEDVNPSFETINTQPVFPNTQADTTTHAKLS